MKPLGMKKVGKSAEGHQECGICHPEQKNMKARSRRELEKELQATQHELERHVHNVTIESDFICPDSLRMTNLRSALILARDCLRGDCDHASGDQSCLDLIDISLKENE